ncbi:MAG: hypothetical protein R2807_08055 [Chitinophagales bacterium]
MLAPLAVNTAVSPEQIFAVFTFTVGLLFTVTLAIAVSAHPSEVPIT